MNFIDQWQEKREFQRAVKNLNVSGGIPLNTAEQADKNSDLEAYLNRLVEFDLGVKETAEQPEKVFNGEAKGLEHAMLIRTRRDTPPQFPPRETFQAELGTILTTQVEPTLAHLTRLAAFNLGIVDLKDQETLVGKTIDSSREHSSHTSFTDIGDDWTLRLKVEDSASDNFWVSPYLIPVDQDNYSDNWIKRKTRNLKREIKPEILMETVGKAAKKNFCVKEVPVARVDPFDLGGDRQMNKIIYDAGYMEVKEAGDPENTLAKIMGVTAFRHNDDVDGKAPLLGRKIVAGYGTVRFSAIVPSELSAQIRQGFQREIQAEAGKIVKERIKKGLKSGGDVDLSPDVVTTEALKRLEQHIVSDDYEDQLDWLCSVVLDETLRGISRYPKTKDPSALLSQVRRLSTAAQRVDDRLGIESESIDAMFSLGWSPDNVALVFPAKTFTKTKKS